MKSHTTQRNKQFTIKQSAVRYIVGDKNVSGPHNTAVMARKHQVGERCNRLLDHADWMDQQAMQLGSDGSWVARVVEDLRFVVRRLAELEQLKEKQ